MTANQKTEACACIEQRLKLSSSIGHRKLCRVSSVWIAPWPTQPANLDDSPPICFASSWLWSRELPASLREPHCGVFPGCRCLAWVGTSRALLTLLKVSSWALRHLCCSRSSRFAVCYQPEASTVNVKFHRHGWHLFQGLSRERERMPFSGPKAVLLPAHGRLKVIVALPASWKKLSPHRNERSSFWILLFH